MSTLVQRVLKKSIKGYQLSPLRFEESYRKLRKVSERNRVKRSQWRSARGRRGVGG